MPARRFVVRGAMRLSPMSMNSTSELTTWSMSIRMFSPGEMCGVTFSVMETSRNSTDDCATPLVMVVSPA
ncbi:hypothetical protein D3C83_314130 [compost metagenome]